MSKPKDELHITTLDPRWRENPRIRLAIGCAVLVVLGLFVIGMFVGFDRMNQGGALSRIREESHEKRAVNTLRAIGAAQLRFQDQSQNLDKNYGTYEELLAGHFIEEGYTRENIVEGYVLTVFFVGKNTHDTPSRFVVIASPRDPRRRTLALPDDQAVRWKPTIELSLGNGLYEGLPPGLDPLSWEPVKPR